jgi:hypothetical protein
VDLQMMQMTFVLLGRWCDLLTGGVETVIVTPSGA